MNWTKHYSKAELGLRIQNVVNNMGYSGVTLYWILCKYINSRHKYKLLDKYNCFFTSSERKVPLPPVCPSDTKEKSTSLKPIFHDEPTSRQPSVDDEPTSRQPSVDNEPNPHGTSVQTFQGARVIKRDYKERIYNNTNLHEWILKQCKRSWHPYIARLLHSEQAAWREVACMQSEYGTLLMRHWEAAIEQFAPHTTTYATERQSKSINKPSQPFSRRFPNLRFSLVNLRFGSVKLTFSPANRTIRQAHPTTQVKGKFHPLNTKKTIQYPNAPINITASPLESDKEANREGIFELYLTEFDNHQWYYTTNGYARFLRHTLATYNKLVIYLFIYNAFTTRSPSYNRPRT